VAPDCCHVEAKEPPVSRSATPSWAGGGSTPPHPMIAVYTTRARARQRSREAIESPAGLAGRVRVNLGKRRPPYGLHEVTGESS
jgi:hypothetical protein